MSLATFIAGLDQPGAPERMNGTAVYLTKETDIVPAALALNVKHNGIVHRHVVLLKVTTERTPRVDEENRVKVTSLPSGFRLLWLVFGFAEKPDVPAALRLHPEALGCDPDEASFFLGRENSGSFIETGPVGMAGAAICLYDSKRGFGPRLLPHTFGSRRRTWNAGRDVRSCLAATVGAGRLRWRVRPR